MTKKADRIVWCNRGWYPAYLGFCPSKKAWNREMKRLKIDDAPYPNNDGKCTAFWNVAHKEGGAKTLILVTIGDHIDAKDHLGIIGLIVHEATHVWQRICEDCGETEPSAEAEAYAMQNITLELIEAYANTRGVKVAG